MLSAQDKETILSYVFERDDSIRIELAVDVLLAEKDIAIRVLQDFLSRVERSLYAETSHLSDDWIITFNPQLYPFEKNMSLIELGRASWKGLFTVKLEPQGFDAKDVLLGVKSDRGELEKRLHTDRIAAAWGPIAADLDGRHERSRSNDLWPVFRYIEPTGKWRSAEALFEFIGDRGTRRAQAIAAEMAELGRAVEGNSAFSAIIKDWEAGRSGTSV